MKNIICSILLGFCLVLFSACSLSSASSNNSNTNAALAQEKNENLNRSEERKNATVNLSPKYPLVLLGTIELNESKVSVIENQIWTDGRDGRDIEDSVKVSDFPQVAKGDGIEVDLIGCAGFLGKGKAIELEEYGWKLKLIPQTLAADAGEKIKQCAPPSYSPKDKLIINEIFAFAPSSDNRRIIKTANIDPKKLFASLPKTIQTWADDSEKQSGRKKGTLTLEQDNWADTDGDGNIDLVVVFGSCESREYTCGSLLYLVSGKWKEIGYFVPA